MSARARPWLPANALRDGALNTRLVAHAERWAALWFAVSKSTSVRSNEVKGRSALASDCMCWAHPQTGSLLAMSANAHVAIAGAMLSLDAGAQKIAAADHKVLRDLAAKCAEDYFTTAMGAFGFEESVQTTASRELKPGFRFSLSLGAASQLIELYIDEQTAVAARQAMLADSPLTAAKLVSREEAVARQTIQVGAMIGAGRLGLGELRALARGDVLVLDRGPSESLTLAINGVACFDAPCNIIEQDGALRMRLNEMDQGGQA